MGTDKRPLYERDPEAWNASLAEGNARQPRKRVATDVIIRDGNDRLLLVNPTYKPDWDLPGGMAEANEAPIDAARRELWEELGLRVDITALLCVDWIPPHGPWDDTVVFVFDGGILSPDAIAALRLSDDELSDFRFCALHDAAELLRPYVWQRADTALAALRAGQGPARYVHRGATVF
jgi:8-oxo-dGTP diphosphatase